MSNSKKLIKLLVKHYKQKELESNGIFKYFTYIISDDNLTLFEKLSINNQIGILTNLTDFDSKILLILLEMLYSKHYFYIDDKSFILGIFDDNSIDPNDFGINHMWEILSTINTTPHLNNPIQINKWIEYLELIPYIIKVADEDGLTFDKVNNYIENHGTNILNLQVCDKLPYVNKYFNLKHTQKFYTIDDIFDL